MSKQTKTTKPEVKQPEPEPQPTTSAAVPTADVIAKIRAAKDLDAAVSIITPNGKAAPKADTVYEVVANVSTPLPQKRGACLKVYAVAVRLDKPFKVADITAALPDVKGAPYWTRRLAKDGFFRAVGNIEAK